MTEAEALERARLIWGPDVWVEVGAAHPGPGQAKWWVEYHPGCIPANDPGWHALDDQGHAVCHLTVCPEREHQAVG